MNSKESMDEPGDSSGKVEKVRSNRVILPDGTSWKLMKDKYSRERGGHSAMLEICCSSCKIQLFIYQKDGPGELKRCYLDRIAYTNPLFGIAQQVIDGWQVGNLACPNCSQRVGFPMIYVKERRPAIRMSRGKFSKSKYA